MAKVATVMVVRRCSAAVRAKFEAELKKATPGPLQNPNLTWGPEKNTITVWTFAITDQKSWPDTVIRYGGDSPRPEKWLGSFISDHISRSLEARGVKSS